MSYRLLVLIAFFLIQTPATAADTTVRLIEGPVLSVKSSTSTIRLRNAKTRERVDIYVPPGATITMDGQPARLREFKRGNLAKIQITRRNNRNEAVVVRVPDPEVVVDLPPPAAEPTPEVLVATALPKTAGSTYLPFYLGLGLIAASILLATFRLGVRGRLSFGKASD